MWEIFCPVAYRQRWIDDHAESRVKMASLQKPDIFYVAAMWKKIMCINLDSARKQDEYS